IGLSAICFPSWAAAAALIGESNIGSTRISVSEPEIDLALSADTLISVWRLTPGMSAICVDILATTDKPSGRNALPPSAALTPMTTTCLDPNRDSAMLVPTTLRCDLGSIVFGSITIFRFRTSVPKKIVSNVIAAITKNFRRTINAIELLSIGVSHSKPLHQHYAPCSCYRVKQWCKLYFLTYFQEQGQSPCSHHARSQVLALMRGK